MKTSKTTVKKLTLDELPKKILIGRHNDENIYLTAPSWDCGWYWGFGYLGNKNCHYHIDGLNKYENINLYDAIKKHFGESLIVKDDKDIWTLTELFKTFYDLKTITEVLGRGGSNYSTNPCKELITNTKEVERINKVVLPEIFLAIYKILLKYED